MFLFLFFLSRMDQSSSAGNPSAASSRSLPAHTLPTEEDQQTRESVSLCGTQNHQRPGQTQPCSVKDQSPREIQRTEEEPEHPVTIKNTNHLDPLTEKPCATKLDPPEPEHEQLTDHPVEDQTQNQRTEDGPPSSSIKDLTVQSPIMIEQNQNERNQLGPQPEKITGTTPERHQDHQDPTSPPHVMTQQASPPPADHQNHPHPPLALSILPASLVPPASPLTIEAFCDQVWPGPPGSSSGESKLCGFLQKQGGPLKAWKQRWFTYEEKKNQLFYYRTPQDVTPLGRVELSGATFTYPLRAERGTFHIRTPERTFILKVDERRQAHI